MKNLKNLTSILLTIAIILAIIPAVPLAADTAALKSTIEGFGGGGLIATVNGDTVTVTGSKTGVYTGLNLDIPAGITVDWQATLSGTVSYYSTPASVLGVSGSGTLNITDGEIVNNHATGDAGYTLGVGISQTPTIHVSGGKIIAFSERAIFGRNTTIYVSGGEITSHRTDTQDGAILIGSSGSVTVSGGTITANGTSSRAISGSGSSSIINISGTAELRSGSNSESLFGNGTTTIIGNYLWSEFADGRSPQRGTGTRRWDDVRWLKVVLTVTFDTDGGTPVEDLFMLDIDTITKPTDPTKDGFAFGGWFTDEDFTDEWDFDVNVVTKNTTLYAKWLDTTDPTGEITIETNKFTTFLNTITFGLLFKNTVDVTITGDDEGSGVASIEYFLSETALPDTTDWDNVDWTTGDFTTVNANWKGIVYARITDNAGNFTVISSNGMIVCDCDVAPQVDCTIAVNCDFCVEEVFPVKPHVYEPQTDLTKAVYCDDCDFKVRDELPTIEVDVVNGKVEIRNNANVFFSTKGYYLTDGESEWALSAMLVRSRETVVIGGRKRDSGLPNSGVVWLSK